MLLDSLRVLTTMESRANGVATSRENASGETTFLKQVVNILKFETLRLRKEEKDHRNLFIISKVGMDNKVSGHTHAKQKHAKMMKVRQPMLSMAVGVTCTTMTNIF